MTLLLILAVFGGGGAGAACRYGAGRVVRLRDRGAFPLGAVLMNVTGCFVLGFLLGALGLLQHGTPLLATVLATAFLGGCTTGGVYAVEGVLLHRGGSRRVAEVSTVGGGAGRACRGRRGGPRGAGMSGGRNDRGKRGKQCAVLLLLTVVGAAVLVRAAHPAPSPVLMTIPLHLTAHAEVDVALDARRSRLFIVNAGVVRTFDTRMGTLVHSVGTGTTYTQEMGGPAPALDEGAGRVVVANLVDDTVTVIDATSGRVRRVIHVGVGRQPDAVALDGRTGRVVVGSTADWTLTLLDVRTGVRLRTRTLGVGDLPGQLAVDARSGHTFVASSDGRVSTFVTPAGRLPRGVVPDLSSPIMGLAVDGRARRVLGLVEARPDIVVLDARTGAWVRTVTVGWSPDGIAVDARTGRAFVTDVDAGVVHVLGTGRGRLLRTVPVGASPLVAVDTARGRAFAVSDAGLSVLDARSGRLLRMLALPLTARAIAVDGRVGRVFVVSGGAWRPPDPWTWLPSAVRRWLPLPSPPLHTRPTLLYVLDERRL